MSETQTESKLIKALHIKLSEQKYYVDEFKYYPDHFASYVNRPQFMLTCVEQRMIAAIATIRGKPGWETLVDNAIAQEAWAAEIKEKHAVEDIEIEYILAELKYNAKLSAAGQKHGTNFTAVDMVWTTEVSADDELAHDVKNNIAAVLENQPLEDRDWIAPTDDLDFMIPTNADNNNKPSQHTRMQLSLIDPSLYSFVAGVTQVLNTPITMPFDERKHIYMGSGPGIIKDMQENLRYKAKDQSNIRFIGKCNDLRNILTKLSLKRKATDSGEALVNGDQSDSDKHPFATDKYVDMDHYINSISQEECSDFDCQGPYSWVPSDILVAADGSVEIKSYINNLHPVKHAPMYRVIERVISRCLPALSQALTDLAHRPYFRVPATMKDCFEETVEISSYSHRTMDLYGDEYDSWSSGLIFTKPKPRQFTEPERPLNPYTLSGEQLQVYVKMNNIYMFPESPEHNERYFTADGGCRENIIATAVYFYDVENIANLHMAFNDCNYCESLVDTGSYLSGLECILYGVKLLDVFAYLDFQLGSVPIKNGTIICYPNTYEQKLNGIKLADPAKRGHIKMLTFYFADPRRRLISTAQVPPQQRRWQQLPKQINAIFNNRFPEIIVNRIAGYVNSSWSLGMAAFVSQLEEKNKGHDEVESDTSCYYPALLNSISRRNDWKRPDN